MRFIRLFLWTFALIALLAMSYVVAIYFLVTPESVSKRISSVLESNFGYKITMHAPVQVRVLPTIEINLPAASVHTHDDQNVFFYRSAHLEVNPIWLVLGQIHVEHLHIDGIASTMTLPANWASFLESAKTDKLAILDDIVIKTLSLHQGEFTLNSDEQTIALRNISLSVNEPAPQMHGTVNVAAQIQINEQHLLLEGSTSLILDLDLHQGIIGIENLQLDAQGTHSATPLSVTLSANLAKLQAHHAYINCAEAKVSTNAQNDYFGLSVADLQLDSTQMQAPDFHVSFAQGSGSERVELDIRSPIIAQWNDQTWQASHLQGSLLLPMATTATPLSGHTFVDFTKQMASIELYGRLHDAPMSFKGKIQGFDRPNVQGQLTFGRLDTAQLYKLSGLQNLHIAQSFQENDRLEVLPSIEETTSIEEQKENASNQVPSSESIEKPNPEVTVPVEPQASPQTEEPVQASPVVWIDSNEGRFVQTQTVDPTTTTSNEETSDQQEAQPFDFSWLNRFDFKGDILIGELAYNQAQLSQVKTPIKLDHGTLTLPKITGLSYDGHFNGQATINSLGHWNAQFKASGVNLHAFLSSVGNSQTMSGKLNTQGNLYGKNFSLATLNGQVGFVVQQTVLYGLDLNRTLRTIEQGQIPSINNDANTSVNKIQGMATLHNGTAEIEKLTLSFDGFELKGQAKMDLQNQTLEGMLSGQNNRGMSTKTSISGYWYQPLLSIDPQAIMKANGIAIKPTVIDKPKDPKPSSWDRIKNFIKDRL